MKSKVDEGLVDAVGTHESPEEKSSELTCPIHLANNLSKELAMGYLPDEQHDYNSVVLKKLKLTQEDIERIGDTLFAESIQEIEEAVQRSIGA